MRKETIDDVLMMETPVRRPTRRFIPTPPIIQIMKDALAYTHELMNRNKNRTINASTVSNESLNISGVQALLDSPKPGAPNEAETSSPSIDNSNNEPRPVLEGENIYY